MIAIKHRLKDPKSLYGISVLHWLRNVTYDAATMTAWPKTGWPATVSPGQHLQIFRPIKSKGSYIANA